MVSVALPRPPMFVTSLEPKQLRQAIVDMNLYLWSLVHVLENQVANIIVQQVDLGGLGTFPAGMIGSITLPTTPSAPATPTGFAATGFFQQIGLSWDLDLDPSITGWELQRADDAGFTSNVTTLTRAKSLSFLDGNLGNSTTKYYKLRTVGLGGTSGYTAVISATTAAAAATGDTIITSLRTSTATIQTSHLLAAIIGSAAIADAAVTTAKIANLAVTTAKIDNLAVGTAQIAAAAITTAKIGALQVTAATIADATITTAKIANAAITNALIASLAVDTANIANLAVTGAKIATATITEANIVAATITAASIADATITAAKIVDATITGAKIASATITEANIVAATITNASIANATITSAKIGTAEIQTANIKDLNVSTDKVAASAITVNGSGTAASGSFLADATGNQTLVSVSVTTGTQAAAISVSANFQASTQDSPSSAVHVWEVRLLSGTTVLQKQVWTRDQWLVSVGTQYLSHAISVATTQAASTSVTYSLVIVNTTAGPNTRTVQWQNAALIIQALMR